MAACIGRHPGVLTWGRQTPRQCLILAWCLLIAACCLVLPAWAAENEAGRGLAAIPPLTARVTDTTGTLPADRRQALEAKLAAFEKDKGAQIAVLIVPSTQPEAIEQYSLRVVEAWKLGRAKVDDGLLLVVAKNDRRLRIEVGYGLEGAVPDAIAKRVVSEVVAPRFTAGDFPGGIEAGVDALIKIVSGEPLPPPAAKAPSGQGAEGDLESLFVLVMIMALAVGQVLRAVFGRLFGSLAVGGATGALALLIAGSLGMAALAGLAAFVFSLLGLSPAMLRGGGLGGGGFGGSRDGGFSGGGGRFGGGGASGGW